MEELLQKAEEIRQLLPDKPVYAADLLIDLARAFSADESLQDEIILYKLQLSVNLSEAEKGATIQSLEQMLQIIIEDYNQELITQRKEAEEIKQPHSIPLEEAHPIVLEARNLTRKFSSTGFHLEVKRLDIRLGHITGLLGENSTGKTTLFRILAGELLKTSGDLRFPMFKGGQNLNWFKLKQQIAYVPQELPTWKDGLTDTLKYEAAQHGITGQANQRALKYVIQRLSLNEHIKKSWKQLSGGYKLRFSLAKALISGTRLLLLDEPLANLDIKTQQVVLNDLYHLTRSKTYPLAIFVSSQHIHEIEDVADWMYYMNDGQLEDLGPTETYRQNRPQNVFELSSNASIKTIMRAFADFPHFKQWNAGLQLFISTPLEVKGEQIVTHLARKGISLNYFRDISQSVKTRFYATNLS